MGIIFNGVLFVYFVKYIIYKVFIVINDFCNRRKGTFKWMNDKDV